MCSLKGGRGQNRKREIIYPQTRSFPGGSVVKNSFANAGESRFDPWGSGRTTGERNGNPLQYSCLGNPRDRGIWQATYSAWGHRVRHNLATEQQQQNYKACYIMI